MRMRRLVATVLLEEGMKEEVVMARMLLHHAS
jgi:hypothetical protein